jgi:Txe/YoeB family toxin of Txe-Axe toxin-antitoxin module
MLFGQKSKFRFRISFEKLVYNTNARYMRRISMEKEEHLQVISINPATELQL